MPWPARAGLRLCAIRLTERAPAVLPVLVLLTARR
jgi:hypothetical protein